MSHTASRIDLTSASDVFALEKEHESKSTDGLPTPSAETSLLEPREGGTRAWLTVAGSATGMFVSFGWVNCIALFQAEYETNQLREYSSSEVAWISSLECQTVLVTLLLLQMVTSHMLTHCHQSSSCWLSRQWLASYLTATDLACLFSSARSCM